MNRTDKNKYPLRKVLKRHIAGEYMGMQFLKLNLLECGHQVPPSSDCFGEIGSLSQRCRICYEQSLIPTQKL